jgi:hypothetical protein
LHRFIRALGNDGRASALLFVFRLIFLGGGVVFLQGILRKRGGRRWFFDGGFVVGCWQKMVGKRP